MLQIPSATPIYLAVQPVDFRKGIDGLVGVCRQQLGHHPLEGGVFVFRNKRAIALKLLCYDGQGYWLGLKRLSQGKLQWWPQGPQVLSPLALRELQVLLWNGHPYGAQMASDWRQVG